MISYELHHFSSPLSKVVAEQKEAELMEQTVDQTSDFVLIASELLLESVLWSDC